MIDQSLGERLRIRLNARTRVRYRHESAEERDAVVERLNLFRAANGSLNSDLGLIAKESFSYRLLRERTKAGLEAARKQGRIGGRRQKLRPHQQEEIVSMVSKGTKTAADAARLFNVHPSTVARILSNAGAGHFRV